MILQRILVMMVFSVLFSAFAVATPDLALVDLQATQSAAVYSPVTFQFKVKNTGDEPVVTRLRIQPYTSENYGGIGLTDLLDKQLIKNVPTQYLVYLSDGSTRLEQVKTYDFPGIEIKNGEEFKFTQQADSIMLNPGEYVQLESEFMFRGKNIGQAGEQQLGLRFVGYQVKMEDGWFILGEQQESDFTNNEQMVTLVIEKRTPLVEVGPVEKTENSPRLYAGQYFIHDYVEYYTYENDQSKKLCADIEGNEVCVLIGGFDDENFPFTINGKQKELSLFAKILYNFGPDSFVFKTLDDFVSFEIDGVKVYLTGGPGWLVEIV